MRLLLDMNLPKDLCGPLAADGHEVIHWASVGAVDAKDEDLMAYARAQGFVIVTHDLDFGALLAATRAHAPSVIQIRTQDVLGAPFQEHLVSTLRRFEAELSAGALIATDECRARVRVLPLG